MSEERIASSSSFVFLVLLGLGSSLVALARGSLLDGGSSLALLALGEKNSVDVGEDTTLGNGDAGEQLVELLVVADGELEVTGVDARLLVVAGSVASELEDLGSEVLEDGSEVHGGTSADALSVRALAEHAVDAADGELEARACRARLLLLVSGGGRSRLGALLATTRHC